MILDTLNLDAPLFKEICSIAIEAGWITHLGDGPPILDHHKAKRNIKSLEKKLLALTLFDKIDCYDSGFDLSRFVSAGLISETAKVLNFDSFRAISGRKVKEGGYDVNERVKRQAWTLSEKVISENRTQIVDHLLNSFNFDGISSERDRIPSHSYLDICVRRYLEDGSYEFPDTNFFRNTRDEIESIENGVANAAYYSLMENSSMASMLTFENKYIPELKTTVLEDADYIVSTKLTDELLIFPYAENLSDVEKIRRQPELKTFRSVLAEWIDALNEGNQRLESKMRNDVRKANRSLKNLSKWKEYKETPFNFWLNAIGGHIPLLSNVLTTVTMIGGLAEKRIESKRSWMLLMRTKAVNNDYNQWPHKAETQRATPALPSHWP